MRPLFTRTAAARPESASSRRLRWIAAGSAIALMLAGAACGSATAAGSGSSKGPITVGVSVPLTGDFSSDGQPTHQGYELWAKFQNAHGGILGRQIQLKFLSDGSSPTQVVTNYQKLITIDHVNFVLGPYSTLLTAPSAKAVARYGYAMIEGIGDGPAVFSQGLHNVFDVSASSRYQLVTFAKWVAQTQQQQPVAYASMEDPFLQPELDGARSYLTSHGFPSAVYKLYPAETTDWKPIADAIAASHAQIVVLGSMPPDGYAFVQDFVEDNYNPKILIEAAGPDQGTQFVKAVGASNTGGIMVPNTWYPGSTYYQNKQMVALYLEDFGGTADGMSADVAEAFAAGQVLDEAVTHTGNTSNSALETYLRSGATFQTVQGPVRFLRDGENGAARPYVFQWQNGVLVSVLPAGVPGSVPVERVKPAWGTPS